MTRMLPAALGYSLAHFILMKLQVDPLTNSSAALLQYDTLQADRFG